METDRPYCALFDENIFSDHLQHPVLSFKDYGPWQADFGTKREIKRETISFSRCRELRDKLRLDRDAALACALLDR